MECPICKNKIQGEPAISRKDNNTEICSECGTAEAMENDLRDSLEWNEYTKTTEYYNEKKQEEIIDTICELQRKRDVMLVNIASTEEKYMNYLGTHKANQDMKEVIYIMQENIENYNNKIYELLEELEKI